MTTETTEGETESEYEIAEAFVHAEALFPDRNGAVPLYSDHPPDTQLPMWRCPCCGEVGPTMKDLWRLYKRRDRLVEERNEYDYPSEEWEAFQEGVRETNRRIDAIGGALPSEVSSWIRRQVEPHRWDRSDLNPDRERS